MATKFAICNEVFGPRQSLDDWRQVCKFVASCGYIGIEVAPFTFAENVGEISCEQRAHIRNMAADCGLEVCGLHWLLVSPSGLHLNARDANVRARTVEYLRQLVHFGADVGTRILTFGSPAQRRVENSYEGAWERALESFRALVPDLEARGVRLCLESLPAPECDFIQTASEAQRMVEAVAHPNFGLMLDAKSLSAEAEMPAALIERFGAACQHFHANDANRRAPGYGDTDFRSIAHALRRVGYEGLVSLEPFDYWPSPHILARESLAFLRGAFAAE